MDQVLLQIVAMDHFLVLANWHSSQRCFCEFMLLFQRGDQDDQVGSVGLSGPVVRMVKPSWHAFKKYGLHRIIVWRCHVTE